MPSPPRRHRSRSPPRGRSRWEEEEGGRTADHRQRDRGRDRDDEGRRRGRDDDDRRRRSSASPPPPPPPPPDPEFGLSGALAADANERAGVPLLHAPPPDATRPPAGWRLYTFKGEAAVGDPLSLASTAACRGCDGLLFGRDRRVADIPTDHASCSKQHAVLLFRRTLTPADEHGTPRPRPYVIDLGSANGTKLNGRPIDPQRYVELRPKDVLAFGSSSREYVLVHEGGGGGKA